MAIVTFLQLGDQLNFTPDVGLEDQPLMVAKIEAAQAHIERLLGYQIEARFGGTGQPPIPPDLCEAVLQLAAHWYEVREAAGDGLKEIPYGVSEIVMGRKDWSF